MLGSKLDAGAGEGAARLDDPDDNLGMRKRLRRPPYYMLIFPIVITAFTVFTMQWHEPEVVAISGIWLVVVWVLLGWSAVASGVWAEPEGIRVRRVFRTRRIPWGEIRAFESRPARSTIPWMDSTFQGIWLVPKRGNPMELGFVCRPDISRFDQVWPRWGMRMDELSFRSKLEELNGLLRRRPKRTKGKKEN